jgi:hypothetical protein
MIQTILSYLRNKSREVKPLLREVCMAEERSFARIEFKNLYMYFDDIACRYELSNVSAWNDGVVIGPPLTLELFFTQAEFDITDIPIILTQTVYHAINVLCMEAVETRIEVNDEHVYIYLKLIGSLESRINQLN